MTATRPLDLTTLMLAAGSHDGPTSGYCVMEAVAYIAGEPWTDSPRCASPVIAAFLRAWNDGMNDADRQQLVPLIPQLVGTAAAPDVEARRSWLAADWLVRVYTPAWLRAAGLVEQADAVAALPEIRGQADLSPRLTTVLDDARTAAQAAWSAAWSAAESALRPAAQ